MGSILTWTDHQDSNMQIKYSTTPSIPKHSEGGYRTNKKMYEHRIEHKGISQDFVRDLAKQINSFNQQKEEEERKLRHFIS